MATLKLGQLKDLLEELLCNTNLSLEMMNFLLASGRREVENRVNAYWMSVTTDFALTSGIPSYSLIAGAIARTAFKDIMFLSYRLLGETKWNDVPHRAYQVLNNKYSLAEAGPPKEAAVDNVALFIFPTPDKAYQMRLHAFEWQDNPTDNVGSSDDLMDRFPEALLYAAVGVGTRLMTKEETLAKPWMDLLDKEIPKIQAYSNSRIKR